MVTERRVFDRELVNIPFIYSLDEGDSFQDGEWREGVTVDIGPVLVGGLAFYTEDKDLNVGDSIRLALFMDLELKKMWETERDGTPPIYYGKICRITNDGKGKKVAIVFRGLDQEEMEGEQMTDEVTPSETE